MIWKEALYHRKHILFFWGNIMLCETYVFLFYLFCFIWFCDLFSQNAEDEPIRTPKKSKRTVWILFRVANWLFVFLSLICKFFLEAFSFNWVARTWLLVTKCTATALCLACFSLTGTPIGDACCEFGKWNSIKESYFSFHLGWFCVVWEIFVPSFPLSFSLVWWFNVKTCRVRDD